MTTATNAHDALTSCHELAHAISVIEDVKGLSLREACTKMRLTWNPDSKNKGSGGQIGEILLGLRNNSFWGPETRPAGLEVKYLPVYEDKRIPKEPTAITMI